ncbi:hypothetical protein, conserved [Eimeria tenella]|uniref:Uncharacterized protein n=1 Tax=Eimeria tenella TaxID=5802 RepID=U6KU25_EIMTE|nr:hypothetical protein, conserved [Eimeria tenella]CDJ38990.1 hypothetical protein, conserved [Eimeria tenella]|eukprot:XP_013229745.1 hypothetical protein, conserved [Eimeria tenella]
MSVRYDLRGDASREPLRGGCSVQVAGSNAVDTSGEHLPRGNTNASPSESLRYHGVSRGSRSCLEQFLHLAPVRCIETVARFLDVASFVGLLTLNSSLLRLCDSPALLPCWTHFALVQRILRHGENVLLPRLSPNSLPQLISKGDGGVAGGEAKKGLRDDEGELVSPCQTFNRRLPRVTRPDLMRIGSLNSNWRSKSFETEERHVIPSAEALDKAYVLATPPLESSFSDHSVAPDAPLSLQACPAVGLPAGLQPPGARTFLEGSPLFAVFPSGRIFVVHAATSRGGSKGRCMEVKLPVLPAKIPREPDPLIKFGGFAPKGWLLGDDEFTHTQPLAPASAPGSHASGPRISQSQRKRQLRLQRQQQCHRLHVSWVHIAPHPLYPCPGENTYDEGLQRATPLEGSSCVLPAALPPQYFTSGSPSQLPSASQTEARNIATKGLGHCPQVRLLSLCLPAIEVEALPPAGPARRSCRRTLEHTQGDDTPAGTAPSSVAGSAEQQEPERIATKTFEASATGCKEPEAEKTTKIVSCLASPSTFSATVRNRAVDTESPVRESFSSFPAVPCERPVGFSVPQRVWPVALCSYSAKGSRFQTHFIVCCALRDEETLKSARCRLWYKEKGQKSNRRGSTGCGEPLGDMQNREEEEEQQQAAVTRAGSSSCQPGGSQQRQHTDFGAPRSSAQDAKAISFSLQKHPQATFVGLVAVGTSEGRILCTPPPRCLIRRCYCGGDCLNGITGEASNSRDGGSPCVVQGAQATTKDAADIGAMNSFALPQPQKPETHAESGLHISSYSVTSSVNGCISCPTVTAARAGRGVPFVDVGSFGDGGGAVDYVELVRGTPWAPRAELTDQPQLLVPTQQRDFSWHWTRPPTSSSEERENGSQGSSGPPGDTAAGGATCGGVEAEALWLFACSNATGIKIFRFVWSMQHGGAGDASPGREVLAQSGAPIARNSCRGLQELMGEWKCVLTIRGHCQIMSLDLNSGILAVCTPRDSRVCFICFKHLLPAHIYVAPTKDSPVVSAEDLAKFGRFGLPRPQYVPLGGYLPVQQRQFAASLQSPRECSRLELLVARRPSFLQPLGGRRWVVVDGSVIRVVQIKVKDLTIQRRTSSAAHLEQLHATLMGSSLDQLRQLRRPAIEESKLPWLLLAHPAPDLQTMRLCVFSHPRTIYQCAFDGIRRLVTVDLQEVLMVWDLQRYTKLFGVDLMASGSRHSGTLSDSQEDDEYTVNGEHMGLANDEVGSDQEHGAIGRSNSRRGDHGAPSNGDVGPCSARVARKASKLSLKKQFGSGWMQKQVLAHCKTKVELPHAPSLGSSRQCTTNMEACRGRASRQLGERVVVGGVWFNATTLEPAVQLQLLYDTQKEVAGSSRIAEGSLETITTSQQQQQRQTAVDGSGSLLQAAEFKPVVDSSNWGTTSGLNADTMNPSCDMSKGRQGQSMGLPAVDEEQPLDPELSAAVAVCYADDFPPLSTPFPPKTDKAFAKRDRASPNAQGTTTCSSSSPAAAPQSVCSSPAPAEYSEVQVISAHGNRGDHLASLGHCEESRGKASPPKVLLSQVPADLETRRSTSAAADGIKPSFAAVVAAGNSSSEATCQRTGWASGPTDLSFLISLVGEEGARALHDSAAAIGMTAEELYVQQMEQWEQLQQRSSRNAHAEASSSVEPTNLVVEGQNTEDSYVGDTLPGAYPATVSSPHLCDGTAHQREQQSPAALPSAPCPVSDVESSKASKVSGSPAVAALVGSPQGWSLDRFEQSLSPSPCSHPLAGQTVHGLGPHSESRMVGLLGRQRCIARLGPNAQRRHVTAVCVSETCLALLFKNLKTWQIWTFGPTGSLAQPAAETATGSTL